MREKKTFITLVLELLGLPINYEWVINTPSGGFHILFLANTHQFDTADNLTKSFTPNVKSYERFFFYDQPYDVFSHIELRWDKHLVLPPSQNEYGEIYQFYSNKIPKNSPLEITLDSLTNLLNEICYDEYDYSGKSGYNLHLSSYYDDNDADEVLKAYSYGEFLDFSPVYFKKGVKLNDDNNGDEYNDDLDYCQDDHNDYERDTFDALTDGQYGDYDDWRENGGDFDSLRDRLGF